MNLCRIFPDRKNEDIKTPAKELKGSLLVNQNIVCINFLEPFEKYIALVSFGLKLRSRCLQALKRDWL